MNNLTPPCCHVLSPTWRALSVLSITTSFTHFRTTCNGGKQRECGFESFSECILGVTEACQGHASGRRGLRTLDRLLSRQNNRGTFRSHLQQGLCITKCKGCHETEHPWRAAFTIM